MQQQAVTAPAPFEQACSDVRKLSSLENAELLALYGLYKQGTAGDNATPQPWVIDLRGRAKWDAWSSHRGTDPAAARAAYTVLVRSLEEQARSLEEQARSLEEQARS